MRIATWNVNSIRTRKLRVVDFLVDADIDVALLQETKCTNEQFPLEEFEAAGYEVFHWGLNQWNGVAIVSRRGISHGEQGFVGMPGFDKNGTDPQPEARAVSATVGNMRLWSVYVPNGRGLNDPHMAYKLDWIEALGQAMADYSKENPHIGTLVGGDFNVAPQPEDVGDPDFVEGVSTHISPAERGALDSMLHTAGLSDLVRPLVPEGFSYFDYKQGKFRKNHGIRIDFLFGNHTVADAVVGASIERDQRTGEQPSDHVPVVVDLHEEEEDFDAPMVF
ncbi:exodeoxyribonuclease-3 [Pontimonas salivibrio]|uniref:Exodeoxyribonuclease-3 n=1 Tax=Pontimonas salivibrio TaxID=1159327 RepID=A0A2L2BN66_9MICO|nr:exodeoxyribonuclease III [Pontimonas salivibrio]AVG23106.1 exodeoxyribonuclease-3 [Pontimonas salivibrio]